MATVLDLSLIQSFSAIFPVLIVWAISFAVLQKYGVLGKSTGINALVAAILGFTILLSQEVIDLVNFMLPWFAITIIFFILLFLVFKIFGATDTNFQNAIKMKEVWWVVITIGLIIFGAAFVNTFGQGFADQSIAADGSTSNVTAGTGSTENFNQNAIDIVFNPKVLGLMTLFLMLVAAVALLTASPGKK